MSSPGNKQQNKRKQPHIVPGEVWFGDEKKFLHVKGCSVLAQAVESPKGSLCALVPEFSYISPSVKVLWKRLGKDAS